jgi:Flp pilus assembly pilin Flp
MIFRSDNMWRIGSVLSKVKEKLREEDGIGVVEVILILVVLIGLVIIFKSQLTSLVQNIFQKIVSESSGI